MVEHEEPSRDFLARQLTDDGFEVFAADRRWAGARACGGGAARPRPPGRRAAGRPPASRSAAACARGNRAGPGTGTCRSSWSAPAATPSTACAASPVGRTTTSSSRSSTRSSSRACAPCSGGWPGRGTRGSPCVTWRSTSPRESFAWPACRFSSRRRSTSCSSPSPRIPERVFRKDELLRDVWGFRSLGRTRTLDSHASRLRRKLNGPDEIAYVINVWGVGYRLVAAA